MATFLEAFGVTALLGLVATLTGRLLAVALDMRLLRRPGPESLLASAFLGTGFLALAYGWASYLGLPAPDCLLVVGLLLLGLAAFSAVKGRLGEVIRLPRPRLFTALVVLALGARVAASLLSLALGRCYYPLCDTMFYVVTAEWLQGHGFGTPPTPDPHQPAHFLIMSFQTISHRMGPMFLLALVRAAVPFRSAAELYLPVMAWGTALNVAGVFLLARWALRVPRLHAAAGAVAVAVAVNSLNYSATSGFFCQVYGTAALAFNLALLSRLLAPANWRPGHAALAGITFSALLSMYSELSPVLALAALAVGGRALWRARGRRLGRLGWFTGLTVLALAAFGNVEHVRAVRSLLIMTKLNSVGWHVDWSAGGFARFALGFYPHQTFTMFLPAELRDPPPPTRYAVAVALAGVAFLLGLTRVFRHGRALPVAVAVLVLAGLITYYALWARDPRTAEVGHTWSLFKLSKWSFPLIAALQLAGLSLVLRRLPWQRTACLVVCAAAAWTAAPAQLKAARETVSKVRQTLGADSGVRDMRRLGRRLDELGARRLYLVSEQTGPWPRCLAPYLLYPRPFANGWKGSVWFEPEWLAEDVPEAPEPGTLYLQFGEPPFGAPVERLPMQFSLIDGTRPLIFRAENPNTVEKWGGVGATWIGTDPVKLSVFSPRACQAVLSFTAYPGPCLPGPGRRTLRLTGGDGTVREAAVEVADGTTVELPVALAAGVSRLEVRCLDQPTAVYPPDARVMLLAMVEARIEVVGPPGKPHPPSPGSE